MANLPPQDNDLLNLDAFSDIMTNVVAILIIIVMVGLIASSGYEDPPVVRVGSQVVRDTVTGDLQPVYVECRERRVIPLMPPSAIGRLGEHLVAPGDVAVFDHYRAVMLDPQTVIFEPLPGAGELQWDIGDDASGYRELLAQLDPARHVVSFVVAPDSFLTFREARDIAHGAGLSTGWRPRDPAVAGPFAPALIFRPGGRLPELQR